MSGSIDTGAPVLSVVPPTNPFVTPDQFRVDFPAFADTTKYPDAQVQRFLDVAGVMINEGRWGSLTTMGTELITAHFLAMQGYFMAKATGSPFPPGVGQGLTTSKSVSKVSVGYDFTLTGMKNGGPWNWTVYGQQYLWWARLVGTGGYETLALTTPVDSMAGTVLTWSQGVMMRWGS